MIFSSTCSIANSLGGQHRRDTTTIKRDQDLHERKEPGDRQLFEETESQLKVKCGDNFPTQPFQSQKSRFISNLRNL